MKHQPYKDWLLSDELLSFDQSNKLQEHLMTCESCRQLSMAWSDVQHLFKSVPLVIPAVGFTARWNARVADKYHKNQRRQSWWLMFLYAGIAVFLLVYLAYQVTTAFDNSTQLLLIGINQVTALLSFANAVQDIVLALLKTISTVVPPAWWVVLGTTICFLSLFWFVSLRKLIFSRRIIL